MTIHVRSLGLRQPDLNPVTGEEVTFSITDPAGNVIYKQQDVMSRFGIASVDCPLATEIIEGSYQIECRVGDVTGNRTVQVQKYVLPKFKIDIELDEPFYEPGQQVTGHVQAKYFFGKPVAGSDVTIDVRSSDVTATEIAQINEQTDEAGRLEFRFRLPDYLVGREQDSGAAQFQLVASVTDTAGQNQSKVVSRAVTAQPITVTVIPEAGSLVQGLANTVYVYTRYPDDRPARTRVVVNGVAEELQTSKLGITSFQLTPQSPSVGLTVKATDREGRVGRRHVQLACGQFQNDFLVRPDKSVYTGGDTMSLVATGGGVEPLFVDFLKDDQTIVSQCIEMADGRGQLEFDLPPDLFGTVRLVAYRFGPSGLAVRREQTIYVKQSRQLNIRATLDQDEYRPGEPAKVRFRLTDDDGNAAPGALSLAAVDEAVFSVLSQSTGMARTFFLLEQELLQPVYAIYDWSPFDDLELQHAERVEFENALFSTTAVEPLGNADVRRKLLPFLENNEQMFEVLKRPDWKELARGVGLSEDLISQLAGQKEIHSINVASYPNKARRIAVVRSSALGAIAIAWGILGAAVLLAVICVLVRMFPVLGTYIFIVIIAFVLIPLFLPAIQSARESSRRTDAASNLRQFALAEVMADESGVELAPEKRPVGDAADGAAPVRVRKHFPETLLWRPELITDDNGVAELEIDLADSITTWRLSASAVSADGNLGGADFPIRVFQPFFVDLNLPVALTRNDEVAVPVVVYNYLDKPQTVELEFSEADWFVRLETDKSGDSESVAEGKLQLELKPGEVRSLSFPIRVEKVGRQQLQVTARGSGIADAVRREIEVVPDGRRVEQTTSGALDEPLVTTLAVPETAIEGSVRAIVKLYPSTFSQLVEGLDAIFQMPSGCFEQTSSTTYPNVLALDYLRRTKKSAPAIEAKARQYIHIGYQRLVTFEVSGGGFDWFGNPPANRTLTAYGLMEFKDMASVHDIDPKLIHRTRQWLLSQRSADGSWKNEAGMLNDGLAGSVQRGGNLDLATTAYIAWAVFSGALARSEANVTLDYLLAHTPDSIDDPYLLAVVSNAIAAIDRQHPQLGSYVARLDAMKQVSDDGKKAWWQQQAGEQTMFYGGGRSGSIETTALDVLAMTSSGQYQNTAGRALRWIIEQKDQRGTWHSTQATVLALKALVAGTGAAVGEQKPRNIEIALDGDPIRSIDIPIDQADVMQQIDLSQLVSQPGQYELRLADRSQASTGYQLTFRYHVDDEPVQEATQEALAISVQYDRTRLEVDDRVTCTATIKNNLSMPAPMVIVDLPIPGGFLIEQGELAELVGSDKIARYQITPRKAIIYLRQLGPGKTLALRYRLKATMPVKVAVPAVHAYHYYDPDQQGTGGATQLVAIGS